MFDVTNRTEKKKGVDAGNRGFNADATSSLRAESNNDQRILLPRGSGQSQFAPQPYYYVASKNGGIPSWIIDETLHKSAASHSLKFVSCTIAMSSGSLPINRRRIA